MFASTLPFFFMFSIWLCSIFSIEIELPMPAEISQTVLQTSWDVSTNNHHTVSDPGVVGTQEVENVVSSESFVSKL